MQIAVSGGRSVAIWQDEPSESPRDWDNLGTLATFHKRYDFTDKEAAGFGFEGLSLSALVEKCQSFAGVALPVWGYDHGAMAIKAGIRTYPFDCPWDSGLFGIIWASDEKLALEGITREQGVKILEQEVAVLDGYINGRVFGYSLQDPSGEVLDSCGGFYGSPIDSGLVDQIEGLEEADRAMLKTRLGQ